MSDFAVIVHAENLLKKLSTSPDAIRRAFVRKVTQYSIEIQRSVKQDKLTGQVLHVRTGTLRRSINREVIERSDGIFAIVGTNIRYGAAWENGFTGQVDVRAFVRRSKEQMKLARFRTRKDGTRVEIKDSYKKAGGGKGEIDVRAHVRNVNMVERSFLRSTLSQFEPRIREGLREVVLGILK